MSALSVVFCDALGSPPVGAEAPLEVALAAYVAAARAPWPSWELDELEFVRHVGSRVRDGRLPPLLQAPDLYLAYACSRGVPGAVAIFQREYASVIDRMLAYRRANAELAAEARQIVQERLLVGDPERGHPPSLSGYRGTGPLRSWVASSAVTTLATLRDW